jgi:mannose-6-phosphate isomerase-like protein (cupin superfamily)
MGETTVKKAWMTLCALAALPFFANLAAGGRVQSGGADANKTAAIAQNPSTPAQPFLVMTGKSMEETVKELQSENKVKNLVNGLGVGCRVFIQHEKDVSASQAEVHDGADDVFVILEGTATLTLGGRLEAPKEVQPGEWRSAAITGGRDYKVSKGDVIVVPRGTSHRRTSGGQEITLMVVKSFAPAAK